jgi:hypothetical protein
MKSLIWKEVRENIKWVPLPGLVFLLKFLMETPIEPLVNWTNAYFMAVTQHCRALRKPPWA